MKLVLVLVLWRVCPAFGGNGVLFSKSPSNLTVSQGNQARLVCAVAGLVEPEIHWRKDGQKLYSTDQMFINLGDNHWETYHNVRSVQQQDAGCYWCEVELHGQVTSSQPAWITVEGVPHFLQEPGDISVFPWEPFNLTCWAVGPPDPVEVVWWVGVAQEQPRPSPSLLQVAGVNNSVKFYCEAKNARGISVSRTGTVHIKVLPAAPVGLQVQWGGENNVTLAWQPGFTGHSELSTCTVQMLGSSGQVQTRVAVPPFHLVMSSLRSFCNYSCHVSCSNEVGASPFSPWLYFQTPEGVPLAAPRNLTFDFSEQQMTLRWAGPTEAELQGRLLAYKVQWSTGSETQEALLYKESLARLSGGSRFFNATFQVAACTVIGCGPWSIPVLVMPTAAVLVQEGRSHTWMGVPLGLLGAGVVGVVFALLAVRRSKETQFGTVFQTPGQSVSFMAARSFNRSCPEQEDSSFDSLDINGELKTKLQDVLIPERQLTLGHMLGKGEFGSVREAFLKTDSSLQKVAVKVMKSDMASSLDMEQCLKEAAYMKDFSHPNVIALIGVSLQRRAGGRLPVPMVILPFMKHGDLHTFLLMSRLGEEPFELSLQTLVGFMVDISRGMDYLSRRNMIHRDLAARNCMLHEDLSVCVADFGLSKKIYSGDYYRQGSASKLPVKWIALESLADNVYTTQSDVWAFGITMWEIVARGQTPYPGVENSEIYEFLIRGERLKKPLDCPDDIYQLMHSCWSPIPRCRPIFQELLHQLGALWAHLAPPDGQHPFLYVNLDGQEGPQGGGGRSPEEARDWLLAPSAAAIAGDYRYIVGPGTAEEQQEEVQGGERRWRRGEEDVKDEDDDAVVNV